MLNEYDKLVLDLSTQTLKQSEAAQKAKLRKDSLRYWIPIVLSNVIALAAFLVSIFKN